MRRLNAIGVGCLAAMMDRTGTVRSGASSLYNRCFGLLAGDSNPVMSFRDLNLSPKILQAIQDAGYTEPTPIQVAAVPPILAGHDLIGIAQTGTGKTAAFVWPILMKLTASME